MGATTKNRKAGILATAAALTLLVGPAYSQKFDPETKVVIDPDELPQNKALDRRYREILNRQPDGKVDRDPWGNVRASEASPKPKDHKDKQSSSTK